MRKFRVTALLLALCFLFCACQKPITDPDPQEPDGPSSGDPVGDDKEPGVAPELQVEKFLQVFTTYRDYHLSAASGEKILLDTIHNMLWLEPSDFSFFAGYVTMTVPTLTEEESANSDLLWSKFETLYNVYGESLTDREAFLSKILQDLMTQNPLQFDMIMYALAKSEDDFSYYYSATEYYEMTHKKEYSGIGVTVRFYEGFTQCTYVNPDGPAAKAGFLEDDVIFSVDGTYAAKLESDDLLALIRGEAGTDTVIQVYRPSDKRVHTFTVTRSAIVSPTVLYSFYTDTATNKNFAVVKLVDFTGDNTYQEFVDFLNLAVANNVEDVLFDVRDNPGGNFSTCLDFINFCIAEKGQAICSITDRSGETTASYSTTGRGNQFDNVVILINASSASAAELFTIALQEHGLATVVGVQSFGKAVGQTHLSMGDGDYLSLTTFELISPLGTHYHGIGVTPDIVVKNPEMAIPEYNLSPLSPEDNNSILQRLSLLGLEALKDYQAMMGLPETGTLDDATLLSMNRLFDTIVCVGSVEDVQFETAINKLLSK